MSRHAITPRFFESRHVAPRDTWYSLKSSVCIARLRVCIVLLLFNVAIAKIMRKKVFRCVCPPVRRSVGPSAFPLVGLWVGWSVGRSVLCSARPRVTLFSCNEATLWEDVSLCQSVGRSRSSFSASKERLMAVYPAFFHQKNARGTYAAVKKIMLPYRMHCWPNGLCCNP